MELLLNVFWLLLALASFALWWTKWTPSGRARGDRRELRDGAVSLACVLFLLFPVISLTDDLHEVPAVAEESRAARRTLLICKGSQTGSDSEKHAASFAETQVWQFLLPARTVIGHLVAADAPPPLAVPDRPFHGRAPPARLS